MAITAVPASSSLQDGQFIQIEGPENILTGYQYSAELHALYFKESQVVYPSFHGKTHIAEDPIPQATCDTQGLMSPDDKCKMDQLVQMRLGVLGFMGAGFPDDGGWLSGDLILAAGTEFISIERIGNVIRFTVDSPVPMNCSYEECLQIFWVQDETSVSAIRPPTCAGKLPGGNFYGEFKVHLFPEATVIDPANVKVALQNKGNYPAFMFQRYGNSLTPGLAEIDVILARSASNLSQTEIGWTMTPGPAQVDGSIGQPECVWFMGRDGDGNVITMELDSRTEPGLLGALLYKGHQLTKQMAVIVDYTPTALASNQYKIQLWSVLGAAPVGDQLIATNVWRYNNPTGPATGPGAVSLFLDVSQDMLPIGTLVDVWSFQIGEVSGTPIRRYFFSKQPIPSPTNFWNLIGVVQFGDVDQVRVEVESTAGTVGQHAAANQIAYNDFETGIWGLTGYDAPLLFYHDVNALGTAAAPDALSQHRAVIDPALPGLRVNFDVGTAPFTERPVMLWNRISTPDSQLIRLEIGRPRFNGFPPYDVLLTAPIDARQDVYLKVSGVGHINGIQYIKVKDVAFNRLPRSGAVRIVRPATGGAIGTGGTGGGGTQGHGRNQIWNFYNKVIVPDPNDDSIFLMANAADDSPYDGQVGDVVELLHQDYSATCVRLQFSVNPDNSVSLQFKVGTLAMDVAYGGDLPTLTDDYIRGMRPGYAVSAHYIQVAPWAGGPAPQPNSSIDGFHIYDGGLNAGVEWWNVLEIMLRNSQIWIWWNGLLIPPSGAVSASLPTPVTVTTPYFPVPDPKSYGKFGVRLWPGASVRRAELRTQPRFFSEFIYGQLELQ